jgi:hypothetical protein
MAKKLKTRRERAQALATEMVLFGKLRGYQWEGLALLLMMFVESEMALLRADEEPRALAAVDPSDGARERGPMREKESFVAGARSVATEGDTKA